MEPINSVGDAVPVIIGTIQACMMSGANVYEALNVL
jgi:hypothetical protein